MCCKPVFYVITERARAAWLCSSEIVFPWLFLIISNDSFQKGMYIFMEGVLNEKKRRA